MKTQFPDNVFSRRVDARVGFAVAVLLSKSHGAAEGNVGGEGVEDIVQRTTQDGFNAKHVVAGTKKVVDGVDDGKSGTDIGFE